MERKGFRRSQFRNPAFSVFSVSSVLNHPAYEARTTGTASGSSASVPQPQPTAMQRKREPERETFCTTKTAPHCGQGLGMGRSQDTKSHFDLA